MREFFIAGVVLLGLSAPCLSGIYEFDLTELVEADNGLPVSTVDVDLETQFHEIHSAELLIRADYSPELVRALSVLPDLNPIVAIGATLFVGAGDVGASSFQMRYQSHATLPVDAGELDFTVPLVEIEQDPIYLFPPELESSTFDELLDGEFSLSMGTYLILPAIYSTLERHSFTTEQVTLRIHGTAVPEPSGFGLALIGCFQVAWRWEFAGASNYPILHPPVQNRL